MNPIVIIADDLTGAADTGVQFCPFYDDTILLSYLQLADAVAPTPGSALALYTNSRALEMMAAQKRLRSVARGLSELKPFQIYKKMDSCLRGNPGTETEALMDELEYEASFIAPAFPEMGRTTVNGNHLVHGIPVGQTEISRDP
ncbi:MAG: four-carbon acid sugar kinase family protein, partial [Desulfobacterales bacterium]